MFVLPRAIFSGIGATVLILLVAACGGDPTVAPTATAVAQIEVQPTPTTVVPTATAVPTPTAAPTATPPPTPTVGPTATATPSLSMGIVTPTPPPTPVPNLDQLGQDRPPQILVGTVTIDGSPAPEGTLVRALVNGVEVDSVLVEDGKYPRLTILIPGQTVTFLIGDWTAAETFLTKMGGVNVLNLTAAAQ